MVVLAIPTTHNQRIFGTLKFKVVLLVYDKHEEKVTRREKLLTCLAEAVRSFCHEGTPAPLVVYLRSASKPFKKQKKRTKHTEGLRKA